MAKRSAGLLMYRRHEGEIQVFLVHLGGPFWAKKDRGAWSIPKGEFSDEEDPLEAAKREFHEETGFTASGEFVALGAIKQAGGKIVSAWAFAGDCDPRNLRSNIFLLEWPPRSGRQVEFPEVDRGAWFSLEEAAEHISSAQRAFLERLRQNVKPV